MDRDLLSEKLESLRRCVARIEQRRARSVEGLTADPDRQDILALNLTRAVQPCIDMAVHVLADSDRPLSVTMGEAFTALAEERVIDAELAARMRAAVGFHDVAVHAYDRLDWDIVHAVSHEGLHDFERVGARIASLLPPADA
jgi:uncharacterized protein YutE (UPF0331/DUF86 family)